MLVAADEGVRGTRWTRALAVLLPSVLVTGFIGGAIVQGAMAANFTVGAQPIDLMLGHVDADGFSAVMVADDRKDESGNVAPVPVLKASIGTVNELNGLCLAVTQSILGQQFSLVINAAAKGTAVGNSAEFYVTELNAGATDLSNIIIGRSADEISMNGIPLGGQPGGFGLDGEHAHAVLNEATGTAVAASVVGELKAPDFAAAIQPGAGKC